VVSDQYHVAYWKVVGGEQGAERGNPLAKQAHVSYGIKRSDVTYVVDGNGNDPPPVHRQERGHQNNAPQRYPHYPPG